LFAHEITIRHALPEDAVRIAVLYAQLVGDSEIAVLPERIAEVLKDEKTGLFVSIFNGVVNGTVLVSLCSDVMFKFQPFAVVENVVVDSVCRGQGIGAALLSHIEGFCLAHDCSKIMLLSSACRKDAHLFFERSGFVGSSKRGFVKYRRSFKGAARSR
jgi:N-acetylglutamate synthase-like GNAT family acetyltransferase